MKIMRNVKKKYRQSGGAQEKNAPSDMVTPYCEFSKKPAGRTV